MLIATPYRDFDVGDKSPPRVISEIRKTCGSYYFSPANFRAKISGDLLLKIGNDKNWWPRKVSVRCGQLLVSSSCSQTGSLSLRLPLRHLSLQAGPLPNSLSLCKGQNKVLTIQTADEESFREWVKTIAIELIRQTPLDAIKYLDIFTIADCWKRREPTYHKDWNFNYTTQKSQQSPEPVCKSCEQNQISTSLQEPLKVPSEVEEKYVEDLLKKCQDTQNYVPVKEKLFLFESLCKLRRKVRSTEDVSEKVDSITKRARSLHDLSNLNSQNAVRQICKYFENKNNDDQPTKRLVKSDSQLNDLYRIRKMFSA